MDDSDIAVKQLRSKGHSVHQKEDGSVSVFFEKHGRGEEFFLLPKLSRISCLAIDSQVLNESELYQISSANLVGQLLCYDCRFVTNDLGSMKALKTVELIRCTISGESFSALAQFSQLKLLRLRACNLTPEGELYLPQRMRTPLEIDIWNTPLDADSFRRIVACPYVKEINISQSGIRDNYFSESRPGKMLRSVWLGGQFSSTAAKRFADAYPRVEILWSSENDN